MIEGYIRTRVSCALNPAPTRGLCLTSLSVCSRPLQKKRKPLYYATEKDFPKIAKLLLKSKADVNTRDTVGESEGRALWMACWALVWTQVAGSGSSWGRVY